MIFKMKCSVTATVHYGEKIATTKLEIPINKIWNEVQKQILLKRNVE